MGSTDGRGGASGRTRTRARTPYTGWSRRSASCCAGYAVPWASGRRLVHADLHPSAYFLLVHIAEHGPVRASALVEAMDLDKGAMSRGVQHLIDLGLVDRTPDPDDGRATLLSVSAEGRTRLADMAVHRRKRLDERLSGWSDDELTAFVSELARYNATLELTPTAYVVPPRPRALSEPLASVAPMTSLVLIATCSELPDLDHDGRTLQRALVERGADRGVEVRPAVWDDPAVDWAAADVVLVRSTWDYAKRRDEFLAWAARVEEVTALHNPLGRPALEHRQDLPARPGRGRRTRRAAPPSSTAPTTRTRTPTSSTS